MISRALSTSPSFSVSSTFTFGRVSTLYYCPLHCWIIPFCWPRPLTSVMVRLLKPASSRDFLTSSSFVGLIIASIFFMSLPSILLQRLQLLTHVCGPALGSYAFRFRECPQRNLGSPPQGRQVPQFRSQESHALE